MQLTAIILDLKPGIGSLSITFIVLEIERISKTKGNVVRTFKVAERSRLILFCLWGEIGLYLQPGDICRITGGYASLWKDCLRLYVGRGGDVQKIGDFCLAFSETPFMSEPNQEYAQQFYSKLNVWDRRSPSPLPATRLPGTALGNGGHSSGSRGGSRPPDNSARCSQLRSRNDGVAFEKA